MRTSPIRGIESHDWADHSPVGMVLYAVQRVADVFFEDLVKAVWIYYIPLLLVLLLITIYAPLVTWLPSTILKR